MGVDFVSSPDLGNYAVHSGQVSRTLIVFYLFWALWVSPSRANPLNFYLPTALRGFEVFAGMPEHPSDCVLLVKQWMCSRSLSQRPMLFLPKTFVEKLKHATLASVPRNPMSQEMKNKYLSTAAAVATPPWHLCAASKYLVDWVKASTDQCWGDPPKILFGTSLSAVVGMIQQSKRLDEVYNTEVRHIQVIAKSKPKISR